MKYNKKVEKVEDALCELGIHGEFIITMDLVKKITHGFINKDICIKYKDRSKQNREKRYRFFYQMVIRDLLKIRYKRNNCSAKGIHEGFVYIISNPAWEGYYKVGSAIDVNDRLSTYQTASPLRDFKIEKYVFVFDRLRVEKEIHEKFERNGEWVKSSYEDLINTLNNYHI